jgi:recombination protein RecA
MKIRAVAAARALMKGAAEVFMSNEKKDKSIGEAIRAIQKQFGSGSIMRLDGGEIAPVEVIPTGSVALDVALGCGGLPRGRIVEIYGPESSGKTTLTLHAIAEAQRTGGVCAFIDAEHALDTDYARRLGVELTDLLVSQPDCGEQALEICDTLVRTGAIDLIVVDSVAALTPRAEIEGDMGDSHMGLQARLMSQALRKLTAVIARTKTVVVFINQNRPREDQANPRRWRQPRRASSAARRPCRASPSPASPASARCAGVR